LDGRLRRRSRSIGPAGERGGLKQITGSAALSVQFGCRFSTIIFVGLPLLYGAGGLDQIERLYRSE